MEWIAKFIFPWLLTRAMKLGAKAFGKFDTVMHAILSRRWMWKHVWSPLINKMRKSKTKMDDPLIAFVYTNQACCLDDGSALEKIVTIQQYLAAGDIADAVIHLGLLRTMLGLDDK